MKSCLLAFALLLPTVGFSANLVGSVTSSTTTVNLSSVGTLDWARWPGYKHKSGAGLISDISYIGTLATYSNDARVIGDNKGVKLAGVGAQFEFTVPATNSTRTLIYYIGGWNSTSEVTVSLPGAATYKTTFSSTDNYSRVVTVQFRADTATGSVLRVRFRQTAGATGSIKMQAAALQGVAQPVIGTATLTWRAPSTNTNGTVLTDLAGYKVYWGPAQGSYTNSYTVTNPGALTYTVKGLTAGRWYFVVAALAGGKESPPSNAVTKLVQ
jgi:fibronectin type III domain protein